MYRDKVIAHAGMIPFDVEFAGSKRKASWFIDFVILPKFQRYGLGTVLTKKWMEFSDIYVTFCNEKSIGVFKKLGWIESFKTHLHYFFILPFDHPKFIDKVPDRFRSVLNTGASFALRLIYKLNGGKEGDLIVKPISKEMLELLSKAETSNRNIRKLFAPMRDQDYWEKGL